MTGNPVQRPPTQRPRTTLWRRIEPLSFVLVLSCAAWTLPILWGWWGEPTRVQPSSHFLQAGALTKRLLWEGETWRLFATIFIHAGYVHLLLNGLSLYFVGSVVARAAGKRTFLLVIVVAGAGGLAGSLLLTAPGKLDLLRVGISGAVFGLLGEILAGEWCFLPTVKKFFGSRTVQIVFFFLALNIFLGTQIKMIDNAAHGGGFLSGLLFGLAHFWGGKRSVARATVAVVLLSLPLVYAAAPFQSAVYQTVRGDQALEDGDRETARSAFEKVLELDPGNPHARIRLAVLNDDPALLDGMQEIRRRFRRRELLVALLRLAESRIAGDPDTARRLLEEARRIPLPQPDATPLWARWAHGALQREDRASAEEAYGYALSSLRGTLSPELRDQRWRIAAQIARLQVWRMAGEATGGREDIEAVRRLVAPHGPADLARAGLFSERATPIEIEALRVQLMAIAGLAQTRLAAVQQDLLLRDDAERAQTALAEFLYALANGFDFEDRRRPRLLFWSGYWLGIAAESKPPDEELDAMVKGRIAGALEDARELDDPATEALASRWFRSKGLEVPE